MSGEMIGRQDELAVLARFLDGFPGGRIGLLLEGEAGIGKTRLWQAGLDEARQQGVRVLSCRPGGTEVQLSFAALGDLLAGVLDSALPRLPDPQRRALEAALLLADVAGPPPDARAVGLAFLSAVRVLAAEGPVLIAVDDLQWIDGPSAQTLEFTIRRLDAEPVGLLAALRGDPGRPLPLELERDFPEGRLRRLAVGPLSVGALHELLRVRLGINLPRPALLRLHEASGGNPFFALEMARSLHERGIELAREEPLPLPRSLQEVVRERIARLPARTRTTLAAAAALSHPTVAVLAAVSGDPAQTDRDLEQAERSGVIEVERDGIRFSHPLLAAGCYGEVSGLERRRLHRRLANAVHDDEERARHVALAAEGADAGGAAMLEKAAARARGRGAPEAAAELAELAVQLTPADAREDARRRRLQAAALSFEGGDAERAGALLEQALKASAPGRERAETLFQLATVLGEAESHERSQELCRRALEELGDADDDLRAAIFLQLAWLEIESERGPSAAEEPAHAALRLAERSDRPELLAQALSTVGWCELVLGRGVREDLMERALALDSLDDLPLDRSPTFSFGIQLSRIYELDRARPLLESLRDRARESGDAAIQLALSELSLLEFRAGNWEAALRYADESYELALQTGRETTRLESLVNRAELVLHLGRVDEARAAASELLSLSGHEAQPALAGVARRVLGELELVLGNAAAAHAELGTNVELNRSLGIQEACMLQSLPDDTEALIALGELDEAETQLEWLEERGRALDRPWALALAARCRGLLAAARGERQGALAAFERALAEHERLPMPFELGRTLLALGSVQRRLQQKRAARETLERAASIFEDLGAKLWAGRTRTELGRIGGRAVPRRGALSATEQQIAELVVQGRTNQEVAEMLSLSPRTVQWNLSKIYRKLGVRSRTELAARLPSSPRSA